MRLRELSIPDAFEFTPTQHRDDRGVFLEAYRHEALREATGHALDLKQVNTSVSARGVVRGVHYALVPPGQAKYVTATRGALLDLVIDLRVGSPTFGDWDSVLLDETDRRAVYLAEGLGHAIVSLADHSTVMYLVSEVFDPQRELAVNVLDPQLGLRLPDDLGDPLLSPKDVAAPTLAEAIERDLLPHYDECRERYAALRAGGV